MVLLWTGDRMAVGTAEFCCQGKGAGMAGGVCVSRWVVDGLHVHLEKLLQTTGGCSGARQGCCFVLSVDFKLSFVS